ncbi:MAG: hypothetical protein ACFFBP_05285 [Promethearchaeota archaeon]
MTDNSQEHIYPEEIRKYEKELIDFIIESGKSKRKTEIESHILGYFLLHPSLTQKQIQDLSGFFREKKISRGAISIFLNQYLSYEPKIILKEKTASKKNEFVYHVVVDNIADMFSISQEIGITMMIDSIKKINKMISSLKNMIPHDKDVKIRKLLLNKALELRDYFIYHMSLLDKFMAGKTGKEFAPIAEELNKLKQNIENDTQMMYDSVEHVVQEMFNFISHSPLFIIEEMKFQPIVSYLMIREKLTQLELQNLTGLSSGLISEGLNYLQIEGYIQVEKIKGIRQRRYVLPSIGYFNMFKFYKRFQYIENQKKKLSKILKELNTKKDKLFNLNGYELIKNRVSEFLKSFQVVEKAIILFEEAMKHFKQVEQK